MWKNSRCYTRFDANKKVNKEENPAKNMVVYISISIKII
jgi:hypothetical protein